MRPLKKKFLKTYLEWDYYAWGEAIKLWETLLQKEEKSLKVLELGGRDGGLSTYFALKNYEVVCSDLNGPSTKAKELHQEFKLNSIKYEAINAKSIPYENSFDIIVFKSVLGGVGYRKNYQAQSDALKSCFKALKPGGKLLFAENSSGSFVHKLLRRVFVKWSKDWNYLSRKELSQFLKEAGFKVQIHSFGFFSILIPKEKAKFPLFFLDKSLNKFIPNSQKYINYGVATKE